MKMEHLPTANVYFRAIRLAVVGFLIGAIAQFTYASSNPCGPYFESGPILPDSVKIERISTGSISSALTVGESIFTEDGSSIRKWYLASLLPRWVLIKASKAVISVPIKQLDYYTLKSRSSGEILGITGIYSIAGSNEAWLGWYGIHPNFQGMGWGKALLLWTMRQAKQEGYATLRLWTTSEPAYARANQLYSELGFTRDDTGLRDPVHQNASLLIFSFGLGGQKPLPFTGSMKEALLGASDEELSRFERADKK